MSRARKILGLCGIGVPAVKDDLSTEQAVNIAGAAASELPAGEKVQKWLENQAAVSSYDTICHENDGGNSNSVLAVGQCPQKSSAADEKAKVSKRLFCSDTGTSTAHMDSNPFLPDNHPSSSFDERPGGKCIMVVRDDDDCLPKFFLTHDDDDFLSTILPNNDDNDLSRENNQTEGIGNKKISQTEIEQPSSSALGTPSTGLPQSTGKKRKRNDSPKEAVKKRQVNIKMWKQNEAKRLLNAGKAHTTSRGKERKEREMGPGCSGKACKRCNKTTVLTEEFRKAEFTRFWNLGEKRRQWDYLSRHVTTIEPVRRTALPGKEKQTSRTYFFTVDGKKVRVCRTMFFDTLGIPNCWMETALRKVQSGGNLSPDKRGKHDNRPMRIPVSVNESVRKHINIIPRVHSHYTRERSKREYIENGLTIERLYKDYLDWAKDNGVEKTATARQYRDVFNNEFNISVFQPKKDQCLTCKRWKTATPTERPGLIPAYKKHLEDKKTVNTLKNQDKAAAQKNKEISVASFDLQKVLPCPKSETSVFFYKNKLSLYNFTVFTLEEKKGFCFVWNESEARRGANEIATNLLMYIEKKASEGCKDLRFYSDSCSGQNRNRYVFSMYMLAASKFDVSICHRFLESGHSYSEVDSMHARIELEAQKKDIYTPDEWYHLILNAKHSGEQYELFKLSNERVLDFSKLVEKQNWKSDTNKKKIMWSKVREVSVDRKDTNFLNFKYDFNEEASVLNVKQTRGHPVNMGTFVVPKAYRSLIPLKPKKKTDLKWLCNAMAIPSAYHQFYQQISAVDFPSEVEDEDADATHSEVDTDTEDEAI